MSLGGTALTPLLVGPTSFLVGVLLLIIVVVVIARVVFGVAKRLAVIAAIVLLALWLIGMVGTGGLGITPPGLG